MLLRSLVVVVLLAVLSSTVAAQTAPTLPQLWVDTSSPPTCVSNTTVVGSDLQGAIDTASAIRPSSSTQAACVILAAGTTYTGAFILRNTANAGWVLLKSSSAASLPAQGTRLCPVVNAIAGCSATNITPSSQMSRIMLGAGENYAMATAPSASRYWIMGIEFITNPSNSNNQSLLGIDGGQTLGLVQKLSQIPQQIIVDRCWVHGTDGEDNDNLGIAMDGAYSAVVDSYVNNFKSTQIDETKGITIVSTTGPLKFVNNYIEGGGENLFFGGDSTPDATMFGVEISDIEIRKNVFAKPPAWGAPPAARVYFTKNLLEFKHGQRALIEANQFIDHWSDGQPVSLQLTPRAAGNDVSTVVQDITVRFNRFLRVDNAIGAGGTRISATNTILGTNPSGLRYYIHDNLATDLGYYQTVGAETGDIFNSIANAPSDINFDHNTFIVSSRFSTSTFQGKIMNFAGNPATYGVGARFGYTNNIVHSPALYVVTDDGSVGGSISNLLASYVPGYTFTNNTVIGPWPNAGGNSAGPGNGWPATTTFWPQAPSNVGFVNSTNCVASTDTASCALTAGSAYHNAATDGTDIGVRFSQFDAAQALGNNAYSSAVTSHTITIAKAGTGTGTVTSDVGGINCGGTCAVLYTDGTVVTLTASPAGGSFFASWAGGSCSGTGTCVITVSADVTVTATFPLIPTFTITATKGGGGTGTVISSPAGINCGATCSATFTSGTAVALTGTPGAGSFFSMWQGPDCGGFTGVCSFTVTAPATVNGVFILLPVPPPHGPVGGSIVWDVPWTPLFLEGYEVMP